MIIKERNHIYLMIILSIILVSIVVLLMIKSVTTAPYKPEQMEQVEVIGKRESYGHDGTGDPATKHLVAFKFPDGSVKEFLASAGGKVYYDSFHEGETGILTYKEREDIEELFDKDLSWEKRDLISFVKDPDYGGSKIEVVEHPAWKWITVIIIVLLLLLFFVWLPVILFKPFCAKHTSQVKVIKKRIIYDDGADNHVIAFKFPDGSVKEFSFSSTAAKSIQKKDTGILTYKESKGVEKVKQDMQWGKRCFISFEKYE